MPANKSKIKLDQLKALSADERGVLSNARCLSEGVDVPSLDGVAFIDPRSSQIDIIQAVGRAIRLSPDKKIGTIVLPVFIAAGKNAEDTIEASNFKPVWDVLNALKAHDDVLACELDQIRTELGRKPGTGVSEDGLGKIRIDLPATVGANFGGALRTYLVEQVTESWDFWMGLLEGVVERKGYAKVTKDFKTADGYRLGAWVNKQRSKKGSITTERRAKLEVLPKWSWDVHADFWEESFSYLKEFADRERHCGVKNKQRTAEGYQLGSWVNRQRTKKDTMSPERKSRLEALPDWNWGDPILESRKQWDEWFRYLKEFADREGHSSPPRSYRTANGCALGGWVKTQRSRKDGLTPEYKARLEALPEWSWGYAHTDKWEEGFCHLKEFSDREGHCRVAARYQTDDEYRLGVWVGTQRSKKDSMSAERKACLEGLPGWSWDPFAERWEKGFRYLKEYADREGHAKVPQHNKTEDGYCLGQWVIKQRTTKDSMSLEHKARLEALPDWVWRAK